MKLILQRFSDNGNSTLGLLFVDKIFSSYTIEDEYRDVKVAKETRIPAGIYNLIIRKADSEMAKSYRKQFPTWFKFHIQIEDVGGFNYVYIHKGNTEKHTDACILVANTANNNQIAPGFIGDSTRNYEKLYKLVYPLLEKGEKVTIDIRDELEIVN